MISLNKFISCIKENAARINDYELGHDGSDGVCDCVGLIIGALRLADIVYKGIHGSNYFERNYTVNVRKIINVSELKIGDIVYKAYNPDDEKYELPDRYKGGTDLKDYYHIGVVVNVAPLSIWHCSGGGMHYDTKLGKWQYAGWCKLVEVASMNTPYIAKVIMDSGYLNIRSGPGKNYPAVGKADKDAMVKVLVKGGQWDFIEYDRVQGYVSNQYLMPYEEIHDEPVEPEYTEIRRSDGVVIRLEGKWEVI